MLFYRVLKYARVLVSLLVFTGITSFFALSWRQATHFFAPLLNIQLIPALLGLFAGLFSLFVVLLLLTLLFGRIYCSSLCPLGTLQDIFIWIANVFKSKKQKKFRYSKPRHIVRYSILTLVSACWLVWFTFPLLALDPYSGFGRVAAHLFGAVALWFNNLASSIIPDKIFYVSFHPESFWIYLSLSLFLLTILGLSVFRGRLYCNLICPAGSLLGLLSPYAAFKPSIDRNACNHCSLCGAACKAACINTKTKEIDYSRCVSCFNCTLVCKEGALSYAFGWGRKRPKRGGSSSGARRTFLASAGGMVGAAVLYRVVGGKSLISNSSKAAIAPPGARSHAHLKKFCTACQACVAACPTRIIKPTITGYGLDGWMLPIITFENGFCSFDCNRCSQVCPTHAIERLSLEEKKLTQIGKVRFFPGRCVVVRNGTDCGACDEHCPTKAVRMVPYGNEGLRIPKVDIDYCIGCGGCEFICPTSPKAIIVQPQAVHANALPPVIEKQEQIVVDDFGF